MADKVALVSGAAQGLGAAIAKRLAEEGAKVVLTDRDGKAGADMASQLGQTFIQQDVAVEAQWGAVLADVKDKFGRLDVLVNNAGIDGRVDVPKDPEGSDLGDWNRIFEVNCAAVFLACKHAIPLMKASGGGSIVNMSSVAALLPTPFLTAYGAAKAGVQHLTLSVALHCAQNGYAIRCNSVHPGQILTPMLRGFFAATGAMMGKTGEEVAAEFKTTIPLGTFQEPVDIANAVLFLASDEARYITGQCLAVDGGFTLNH